MSLQLVNEEIDPESHCNHGSVSKWYPEDSCTVTLMFIPNKLYFVDEKLSLECQQCVKSLKLVASVNATIKDSDV